MAGKLKTRINDSGYREFFDEAEQRWVRTHRRVAEKSVGGALPPDAHVHHINEDKLDNRPENLAVLRPSVHNRIHREDADACFRCGRSGHWADDCYAATTFAGEELDDDEDDFDDELEDDDEDDDEYEDDDEDDEEYDEDDDR